MEDIIYQISRIVVRSFRLEKFVFSEILGEGLTAKVFKCNKTKTPDKFFAIKRINKT